MREENVNEFNYSRDQTFYKTKVYNDLDAINDVYTKRSIKALAVCDSRLQKLEAVRGYIQKEIEDADKIVSDAQSSLDRSAPPEEILGPALSYRTRLDVLNRRNAKIKCPNCCAYSDFYKQRCTHCFQVVPNNRTDLKQKSIRNQKMKDAAQLVVRQQGPRGSKNKASTASNTSRNSTEDQKQADMVQ